VFSQKEQTGKTGDKHQK